jgi:hypothetical protein
MGTFTAKADSSTEIGLSWNIQGDEDATVQSATITQTDPAGNQKKQVFGGDDIGTTFFHPLNPSTLYNYELDAIWIDDAGDSTTETLTTSCATPATPSQPGTGHGGGGTATVPVPGRPTNLTASWNVPDYNEITVTWNVGGYTNRVEVSAEGPAPYLPAPTSYASYLPSGSELRATIPGVKPGPYNITVTDSDVIGSQKSSASATCTLSAPPPVGPITKLVASWNSHYTAVNISWSQGSGSLTTGVELKRYAGDYSESGTAEVTAMVPLTSPSYTDTPPVISGSSQYQYQLIASNSFSSSSEVSNVLSPPQAPAAPANVVAKWTVNYTQVEVTWDPVDHTDFYEVVVWKWTLLDGPSEMEDHTNITTTTFTESLTGRGFIWYQFQVIAHNRFGSGSTPIYPDPSTTDTLTVGGSSGSGTPPPPGSPPPFHHPVISNKP